MAPQVKVALQLGGAVICALFVACAHANARAQQELADRLRLTVARPISLSVGGSGSVKLMLQNVSGRAAVGCVAEGGSKGCSLFSFSAMRGSSIIGRSHVDHPRCRRPLHLAPGETTSWQWRYQVREFPSGAAILSCSVPVSIGRGCSPKYGCRSASVSVSFEVEVSEGVYQE